MRIITVLLTIAIISTVLIQCTVVNVNLRIEGEQNTIFAGNVMTNETVVKSVSSESHRCDGTNNNANAISGPTVTSTLELAAMSNNFTWDGIFYELYDDYSIIRIGNTSQTKSQFWNIFLNYKLLNTGGCQQKVNQNDDILFAFDAFNKKHCLKLQALNSTSKVGSPFVIKVTDGLTNQPIQGATIANQLTDTHGLATLIFHSLGVRKLQAERNDSVRSNTIQIHTIE